MIRCRDGSLYTGVTTDVKRRFSEHNEQGKKSAKYLRGKGPLKLAFSALIGEKQEAYKIEHKIKRLSKIEKEKIIKKKKLTL